MVAFFLVSLLVCGAVGIWGVLTHHHDLWFMVKGALINALGLVVSAYAVGYGLAYGVASGGGWWLVALIGGGFGYVCGSNLWHFLSGHERRSFVDSLGKEWFGTTGSPHDAGGDSGQTPTATPLPVRLPEITNLRWRNQPKVERGEKCHNLFLEIECSALGVETNDTLLVIVHWPLTSELPSEAQVRWTPIVRQPEPLLKV